MRFLIILCVATLWGSSLASDENPPMPGGKTEIEVTPEVKEIVYKAINSAFNERSNDLFYTAPSKIIKVESQVVAGIKYTIQVVVGRSSCMKNQVELAALKDTDCTISGPLQKCTLTLWERVWLQPPDREIYDNEGCEPYSESKRLRRSERVKRSQHVKKNENSVEVLSGRVNPRHHLQWHMFVNYIDKFQKSYESKAETMQRFVTYRKNLKYVKLMQANEQGSARYGDTIFSDMLPKEFRQVMLPYQWEKNHNHPTNYAEIPRDYEMPASFDWRDHGAVTEVKNQGSCGSCWAFSTTGNIEGAWAIKKGKLVSLSEQELVDCDTVDQGCNGGLPSNAYKEIMRMGGLEPETDYSYDGKGESCRLVKKEIAVYINDSLQFPPNETAMAAWLSKNGPISIGLNANAMQFYTGGISHPWRIFCSPKHIDHGVLIVGYGLKKGEPYWIIKNSWGASWGENGYYLLYRGKGVCGVDQLATSAVVD